MAVDDAETAMHQALHSKARRRVRIDAGAPAREARREVRKLARESEGYVFSAARAPATAPQSPTPLTITVDGYHDAWAADRERRGRSERGRYRTHVKNVSVPRTAS